MNITSFIVSLLQNITTLGQKLYDVVNYKVNLSWITNILEFLHSDLTLPKEVSIFTLIFGISAIPLAIIIVYSIFKP